MRTSNPALNQKRFEQAGYGAPTDRMTVDGTVTKTALLLFLVLIPATWMWGQVYGAWSSADPWPIVIGGAIGGFIVAMVTIFKPTWSPVTAPLYAVLQGLFLGGISARYNMQFEGIVVQAVALTFGTLLCLLLAYRSGLVRATENFKLGVVAATGAVCLVYIATLVLGLFGVQVPYIHGNGLIGIGFSLVVVVIASLNLVLDFDFIEQGAEAGAPRYMEWYAAFGLMVTLIWLYLEMLRLLSKLNSRD